MTIDWEHLREQAELARAEAYAPYSNFRVGAALLCESGEVVRGCNVENASYGLCLCAERGAVSAAVARGLRTFIAIAVTSPGPNPATPCGMCRQVLSEFGREIEVRCYAEGKSEGFISTSGELLPHGFDGGFLDS